MCADEVQAVGPHAPSLVLGLGPQAQDQVHADEVQGLGPLAQGQAWADEVQGAGCAEPRACGQGAHICRLCVHAAEDPRLRVRLRVWTPASGSGAGRGAGS